MPAPESGRPFRPSALSLWLLILTLAGCSTAADSGGDLIDPQGKHPADIVATHADHARPDGSACTSCHGGDLHGGISGVSCFSASHDGTSCHASGPAFHAADWIQAHAGAALADATPCLECHGADLRGGSSGLSCFSDSNDGASCHAGGPVPPDHDPATTWINAHQGAAAALRPDFTGCNASVCHGASLGGEPPAIGPSCSSSSEGGFLCHPAGPPPDFHVTDWYAGHRVYDGWIRTLSCRLASCHGATLHGDPPDATGPSCFLAAWGALPCHADGP